ncbi:hypothetical protein ALI22I_10560 [Saccharothrix sp. ALI-22-I]|nr:hypothetical protein ALI22I_10560 [Saccharothrix sp. ALI-22-I]
MSPLLGSGRINLHRVGRWPDASQLLEYADEFRFSPLFVAGRQAPQCRAYEQRRSDWRQLHQFSKEKEPLPPAAESEAGCSFERIGSQQP